MPTKQKAKAKAEKEKDAIDHPGLWNLLSSLAGTRKTKSAIESQEEVLNTEAKAILEELGGPGEYWVDGVNGEEFKFSFIEGRRVSVDRELLLEAGVDPEIIARCSKESKYKYIGPIKSVHAQEE